MALYGIAQVACLGSPPEPLRGLYGSDLTPSCSASLLWQFRDLCDRHFVWPAFYHITPASLPQFVELGLTFQKLGEEELMPLDRFSVEGLKSRNLRYTLRHLRREGCRFEIVAVEHVPSTPDTFAATSAEWLASRTCARRASRSAASSATCSCFSN